MANGRVPCKSIWFVGQVVAIIDSSLGEGNI